MSHWILDIVIQSCAFCAAPRIEADLLTKEVCQSKIVAKNIWENTMRNVKVSIVIPAYNEAKIIRNTIEAVLGYFQNSITEYELIIADDGSTDDTRQAVESIHSPSLRYVEVKPHGGKGKAVREGMLKADGDIIVYTDADLAYGLKPVDELIQIIKNGDYELAIGSRKIHPDGYENYPPIRLLASRLFSYITGRLAGFDYDTQCGLKAFTARAAKDIFRRCGTDGFAFDFEVIMYAEALSYKVTQSPVSVINHRQSKVRIVRDSLKMFTDIIRIRRSVNKSIKEERLCDQK